MDQYTVKNSRKINTLGEIRLISIASVMNTSFDNQLKYLGMWDEGKYYSGFAKLFLILVCCIIRLIPL